MPSALLHHTLSGYHRDGFAVFPGVFAAGLLSEIDSAIEGLHQRALSGERPLAERCVFDRDLPDKKRGGNPLPAGDSGGVFIVGDPSAADQRFYEALTEPKVVGIVEALLGSSKIVTHFMNITTKSPRFGASISWHRDHQNKYIATQNVATVRIMLCIDPMSPGNGATTFIPGSHTNDKLSPDNTTIEPIICDAGSIVAIHPMVLHGGSPNLSEHVRRNIVMQWGLASEPLITSNYESITGLTPDELRLRSKSNP